MRPSAGILALLMLTAVILGSCSARGASGAANSHRGSDPLPGFESGPHWDEQVLTTTLQGDIRVHINAPAAASIDPSLPVRLIVYALPNGNTIEWTAGKLMQPGDDWHFDIQHIDGQTRRLREVNKEETVIVAYLEAPGRSWPTWRRENADSGKRIVALLDELRALANPTGRPMRVLLTGHSGGGSLTFGYLNEVESIAPDMDRIAFLDSNYGYDEAEGHGAKLQQWLRRNPANTLVIIAYDDREIEIDGRKVVGPTGGTWRATHRLIDDFGKRGEKFQINNEGDFLVLRAMNGQLAMFLHPNPDNKILHTVLVGEMNGLLQAATLRTKWEESWGRFGGPRAYMEWVR
jgi:hypothetical protein